MFKSYQEENQFFLKRYKYLDLLYLYFIDTSHLSVYDKTQNAV